MTSMDTRSKFDLTLPTTERAEAVQLLRSARLRKLRNGTLVIVIFGCSLAFGPLARGETSPPGADVSELLQLVHKYNPDLAARALDSDAAFAKAAAAGSLDDPMLRITSDEVDRTGGGRINKMKALKLVYFADRYHLRSRTAYRRGPRPYHRAATDRRPGPRDEGAEPRHARDGARRQFTHC